MTLEAALSGKKALEAHLDNEFVFLAQFIRFYKGSVPCKDEPRCVAWLQKLLSPVRDGTTKIVRNTYLAELLVAMQSGHLGGPFAKKPSEGALAAPPVETGEVGEPAWLDTVVNTPVSGNEVDERTYIATQTHPDGKASYAYLAVSTTDSDHWFDSHARDNESTLNLTPPRSHAPTNCHSCPSVNPIPEEMKLPCTQDQQRCRTRKWPDCELVHSPNATDGCCSDDSNPLAHFYDEVLALVEGIQRTGCSSDDAYITQLLKRMKDQAADFCLLETPPQQLLTHREQARRKTMAPPLQTSEDCPDEYRTDSDLSLDEDLWETAASGQLSPSNMMLLASVYPPELVSRFVKALIRERRALIARMRAEHEVLVTSLRGDVQKDIEKSLDRFREARAQWLLLLRATQELQHIKKHELTNSSAEKGLAIRETVREIRDAMMALDEEGRRGTHLADQLVSEHQDLFTTEKEAEKHAQRLLAHNEALRTSLQIAQAQEAAQLRRISELQHELALTAQPKTLKS